MDKNVNLEDIYRKLLDANYDLECYVKVLNELEDYYYYADNIEACRRFHVVKSTCSQIQKKVKDGLNELDLYLMNNKQKKGNCGSGNSPEFLIHTSDLI